MDNSELNPSDIWSVKEVSEFLKIPQSTIYELAKNGKIPCVKFGKHLRFLREDIIAYLRGTSKASSYQPAGHQRRQYERINTSIQASLKRSLVHEDGLQTEGMICNLSEGGIFFASSETADQETDSRKVELLEMGDPVTVTFNMPGEANSTLEVSGRVVHRRVNGHSGLGIKFRNLSEKDREVIKDYVG